MSELKVQFGCGGNILEGWKNHDAEVPIEKPLPYYPNSVDFILAEHVVEHVTMPQALAFLTDCYNILKPGGILRVCCPVVGRDLERGHVIDLLTNHGHLIGLNLHLLRTMLWAAGFNFLNVETTKRKEIDGHWKVIGLEKDDLETCRMEAVK